MFKDLRFALPAFLCSRALLIVILVSAHSVRFDPIPAREEQNFHAILKFSMSSVTQSLHCVFSSADAHWYSEIAENGYDKALSPSPEPKNWVFFPLYPLSINLLNHLTGSSFVSGLLISNLCFLLALSLLPAFAAKLGLSRENALRICWLLCLFPTSYFFAAPLSEAPFLLLCIFGWYSVLSGRPIAAGLAFCALGLVRPTGMMLLPAFAFLLYQKKLLATPRGIIALCIAPLGSIAFMIYLHGLTGDWFAYATNQLAWGRTGLDFGTLASQISERWRFEMEPWNYLWLNAAAVLLGICAALWLVRRNAPLALFLTMPLAVMLSTGTLWSTTRFIGALFPVYLYLDHLAANKNWERAIFAVLASLFAILTALYGAHVTLAMA